ncbi:MAG: CoA transferase [Actinomycetota bacterium]|nr:CoA transferase [Actinomycetota bacterium]
MEERDPGALADEYEREADDMERRGDKVDKHVRETREDWEQKRSSEGVPGANPMTASETESDEDEHERGDDSHEEPKGEEDSEEPKGEERSEED